MIERATTQQWLIVMFFAAGATQKTLRIAEPLSTKKRLISRVPNAQLSFNLCWAKPLIKRL